ncbi:MAG TPA: M28 family peptidase [Caulobacteraceae bacterium]|jgi:Zn-dependent M28 family amino/carboxypeptidase|nr:M28 family peptidase [Caulobacteraceae bacterium]
MVRAPLFAFALIAGAPAVVAAPQEVQAPAPREAMADISRQIDPAALRATIERLVSFGTRHTLSETDSPNRGIGAARRWVASKFSEDSARCGASLTIETPQDTVTGSRIPKPAMVQDVIAIQRGTTDPDRVVIISGHIDSRVTDVMNATSDAPGANDDASGVAAVMESARVLSCRRFPATIVYAVLSGEEQGLYGGQVLAEFAKAQHWLVEAVLNNDIIGNTHGQDGRIADNEVRVFSEGTRANETPELAQARRLGGGENDAPSRNLSRYMQTIAADYLPGFSVRQIWRADRFHRGGDQAPMQAAGYPAVRVTEADENYTRQHQDVRTENGIAYGDVVAGVDFVYLARVTRLNALTLAALARAPAPPSDVKLAGAVTADTTVNWSPVPGAADYTVWWRETTAPQWTEHRGTTDATVILKGVNIDDFSFGVSSRSADGYSSPVVFAGPVGAF